MLTAGSTPSHVYELCASQILSNLPGCMKVNYLHGTISLDGRKSGRVLCNDAHGEFVFFFLENAIELANRGDVGDGHRSL